MSDKISSPFFTILICLFCLHVLNANTITAVSDGNWHSSTTWDNGVPIDGDDVIIPTDKIVTINQHVNLSNVQIELYGTITLNGGKKITLADTGVIYIISPGIVIDENNGNKIIIDNDSKWVGGDGDIVGDRAITTNSNPANSPNFQTPVPPSELLPVELTYFKAVLSKTNTVELEWQTTSEHNNHHFEVERSKDGKHWHNIEKVTGRKHSIRPQIYHAKDASPYIGFNYYRLKQIDLDGNYEYSKIVLVRNYTDQVHRIFPNPTLSIIHFQLGHLIDNLTNNTVKIYNAQGQCIIDLEMDSNFASYDLSHCSPGIYYYYIMNNNNLLKKGHFIKK